MLTRLVVVSALVAAVLVPGSSASAQTDLTIPVVCQFVPFIGPGQSIEKSCLAINPVSIADVTAWTFVDQDSIRVFDEQNRQIPRSDPDWETYVGFFRLSVSTQRVLTHGDPAAGEGAGHDLAPLPREARGFRDVCTDRKLTDLPGGEDPASLDADGCRLGRLRGLGTLYPQREYIVKLTMLDDGDQSRFAGWGLQWNEIQRNIAPAQRDCGVVWTCEAGPAPDTYER